MSLLVRQLAGVFRVETSLTQDASYYNADTLDVCQIKQEIEVSQSSSRMDLFALY